MPKMILTNIYEEGRICAVAEEGEQFDVHPDFRWYNCSNDDVTEDWRWRLENGELIVEPFDPTQDEDFRRDGYKFARVIAYKDVGEQLDMLYKELQQKGSIDTNGAWFNHVSDVKNTIPKDDPDAVVEWYRQNAPSE